MFRTAIAATTKFLYKYRYNILFYWLSVAVLYFNFWLFFDVVERQIATDLPSTVFLHLATCFALSLPFFWAKIRKGLLFCVLFFINIYLICNLLYYRTYFSILPLDSYTMISNLGELTDSIISAFHWGDILFVVPTLALLVAYLLFFRKRLVLESGKLRLINSGLIIMGISATIGINLYIDRHEVSNLLSDENEFKYDVVDGASTYGFLHCWIWQFKSLMEANKELTPAEKTQIQQWLAEHKKYESFDYPCDSTRKNLILIIVESLESFPIGNKLAGQEITPFLNSLIHAKNCFYAPHMVPQVNIGHSSDTQLIFNTGMLPPHNGAACFKYQHNSYYSLAKALHSNGYNSHTLLGGNGSFWNQGVMTKTLGYDELIAIEQFRDDESYDFGLTDSTFLAQSVEKVNSFKSPFLAQLITLSSHDPYVLLHNRIYLKAPKDCPPEMARYLNAVHYVDKCLGIFIAGLRTSGVLDKSIVVISGDHDGTKQQPAQWEKYAFKQWHCTISQTPFIVVNSPVTKTYTPVAGQIDVYPTLLDMLGLKSYGWHGLGQSLFSKGKAGFAVNARFDEFGNTTKLSPQLVLHTREVWQVSDLMIRNNYFEKK
jgi:phosphoglycerol transferase MdoB-like AlkP superfamily enzyme